MPPDNLTPDALTASLQTAIAKQDEAELDAVESTISSFLTHFSYIPELVYQTCIQSMYSSALQTMEGSYHLLGLRHSLADLSPTQQRQFVHATQQNYVHFHDTTSCMMILETLHEHLSTAAYAQCLLEYSTETRWGPWTMLAYGISLVYPDLACEDTKRRLRERLYRQAQDPDVESANEAKYYIALLGLDWPPPEAALPDHP